MKQRPIVSLCVIHRRAGAGLARLVESLRSPDGMLFDELVFVDTGPADSDPQSVAARVFLDGLRRELGDAVVLSEWQDPDEIEVDGLRYITDFAAARNFAHGLARGEWTAFLDSDDELEVGEHGSIIGFLKSTNPVCVWADYEYGAGLTQPRNFIWREDLTWTWDGRLHEERRVVGEVAIESVGPLGRIVHHGDAEASERRNMAILGRILATEGTLEPKLYLAYGAGLAVQGASGALAVLRDVAAEAKGSVRYKALTLQAELLREQGDTDAARDALAVAAAAFPAYRTAHVELGFLESKTGSPQEALRYFERAFVHGVDRAPIASSEIREELYARLEAALVASALGRWDAARAWLAGVPEKYAEHPQKLGTALEVERRRSDAEAAEGYDRVARYLVSCDEVDRAAALLDTVPHRLRTATAPARTLVQGRVYHLGSSDGYDVLYAPVRPVDMQGATARKVANATKLLAAVRAVPESVVPRVLEVGCGTGWVIAEVVRRAGREVRAVGVDVGAGRIAAARERAKDLSGLEFIDANVEADDFVAIAAHALGGPAHAILMAEVLEHVASPEVTLEHLRLLLGPDGVLFLTTPDAERYDRHAPHARRTDLSYDLLQRHREHVRVYDCHRLVAELEEAGFDVSSVEPGAGDLLPGILLDVEATLRPRPVVGYVPEVRRPRLDIYAPSPLEWGPHAHEEGFAGGSEQAVCHLAPLLVERGWDVHVFAYLDREAWYRGVFWHHLETFDLADARDCLVVWRDVQALRRFAGVGYPVVYWAHDVPDPRARTVYDLARTVLTLSPYHTALFRDIVSDHVQLEEIGNGVAPAALPALPEVRGDAVDDRDPHRAIYCSSASRGLLALLRMWPDVRKVIPDARLEVCYDMGLLRHPKTPAFLRGLADTCEQLMDRLEGVTYHGGLPQRGYLELAAGCGVWAYPTIFPEVYCIVAAEMQALGLIPVTTDKGALKTTVLTGSILPWEALAEDLRLTDHEIETGHIYAPAPDMTSARFVSMVVAAMNEEPVRVRGGALLAPPVAYNAIPEPPVRWGATERLKLSRAAVASYDWSRTSGAADRALHEHREKEPCPQPRQPWGACSARSPRSPSRRPPRRP